ncbi:EAL domain-containing protein [Granulicella sp. L60]|uniref:EAL domain-containing protein n=1 Tax=Granulicella sp. L60 TaxID=1641866 RepID=UPI0020B11EB6|nr:EAL domain-containing protein [Granulicella sp. L60]
MDGTPTSRSSRVRRIVRSGLTPSFQPIYAVGESSPFAVEGFIRGPAGNALEAPMELFQAAHESGMSLILDEAAYTIVLKSFARLQWPGKLFLNVQPSTLQSSAFAPLHLQNAIKTAGLHPSQIILELTEHEPIHDAASLLKICDPLFDEGITLSLDDVGAGFASMRLVCELQPHIIKLDRFFIAGIAGSFVKRSVVQNFVNVASDIGARVVAEGVEQGEDAWTVIKLGIGLMQGHHFGRPAAEPDLAPLPQGFWDALSSPTMPPP